MRLARAALSVTLLAPASPALAQDADGLDISGTVRIRYETVTNQPRPGYNRDDDLLNLRTTLLIRYQSGPFTVAGELWDSRVYDGNKGTPITTGEVNTLEPVQAYVGIKTPLGDTKLSGQLGRFKLNLGSRRLIGSDEYRNTTNGYTGLRLDLERPDGLTATGIYVLPQQRRPDSSTALRDNAVGFDHEGFDEVLWGGLVARPRTIGPIMAEASFFHFGEHDTPGRPTRHRSLNTIGGRLLRDPASGAVDGEIETLYQSGRISASTAPGAAILPVSAWFIHAAAGYSFPGPLKLHLSLQYDRASGEKGGGHYGRFDTLFGMRRAELAPAGLYNAVGRANFSTPSMRLEIAPGPRWDALFTYHALWLASRTDSFSTSGVRDPSGRSGAFAGHQLDSRVRWWLLPARLRFELDETVLLKGRFLRDAPNAPPGKTTAYSSFNLTASF